MAELATDYLVVGAGALAMAFVDQLLTETGFDVIMLDRRSLPGGHWVDAYPFLRLHQPSAFYGVGSRRLGSDRIDAEGPNAGYYELATGPEIAAYFEALMRERFLPSGRVRWFPGSDYLGGGRFVWSGETHRVTVRRKLVDSTYSATEIPATHTPGFEVGDGVAFTTPNRLPQVIGKHGGYVVLGGGKTAMDVCVWLLQAGVDPDSITWVRPRDAWLSSRDNTQPGAAFLDRTLAAQLATLEACAEAQTCDDLFARLERAGAIVRLDPGVRPTMFRNAIISLGEVELLRTVGDVVRMGKVRRIEREAIHLDEGTWPVPPGRLYVDCTARGLSGRPGVPVFDGDRITLQKVRSGYICLSAALAAHVEAAYEDEARKNALCMGMIAASQAEDWLRVMLADLEARERWDRDPDLLKWVAAHRLSGRLEEDGAPALAPAEAEALRARIDALRPPAQANLARLVAALDAAAMAPALESSPDRQASCV
jgi:hypothetical protein